MHSTNRPRTPDTPTACMTLLFSFTISPVASNSHPLYVFLSLSSSLHCCFSFSPLHSRFISFDSRKGLYCIENMGSATLDASHIKSLVATLGSTLQDPDTLDEAGRIAALEVAKSLTDALEPPQNGIAQMWLMVSLPRICLPTKSS